MIGPPATGSLALRREREPYRRVLFLSSNGIGMGRLTRLLAVARRCGSSIEPVFLAMSQTAKVVEDYGFLVELTAHHLYLDLDVERWKIRRCESSSTRWCRSTTQEPSCSTATSPIAA